MPVPFLEVSDKPVGHPERYVTELIDRGDGYIWVGDIGYPRECVSRVIRLAEPKKKPADVSAA